MRLCVWVCVAYQVFWWCHGPNCKVWFRILLIQLKYSIYSIQNKHFRVQRHTSLFSLIVKVHCSLFTFVDAFALQTSHQLPKDRSRLQASLATLLRWHGSHPRTTVVLTSLDISWRDENQTNSAGQEWHPHCPVPAMLWPDWRMAGVTCSASEPSASTAKVNHLRQRQPFWSRVPLVRIHPRFHLICICISLVIGSNLIPNFQKNDILWLKKLILSY